MTMRHSESCYGFWAEFDGREVTIDGRKHVLRVATYEAIFPIRERVVTVYADPVDKDSEWYCAIRADLGDDWSTDVLDSPDVEESVLLENPDILEESEKWFQTV
jgi:hypothetical protein